MIQQLRDLLLEAGDALRMHRLRSSLSIVGVICGVAAIVSSVAIVEGGRRDAIESVAALGERNVIIRRRALTNSASADSKPSGALTVTDLDVLRSRLRGVDCVAAVRVRELALANGSRHVIASVLGITPEWQRVMEVQVERGRRLTTADLREQRRVLLLGTALAAQLFPDTDPVGSGVMVSGDWYSVIGVLAPRRRAGAASSVDADRAAFAPFSAVDWKGDAADGRDHADELIVRLENEQFVDHAAQRTNALLGGRLVDGGVEILVPREIMRVRLAARRSFDAMLLGVATVSLLISGIAIMNIMLVSVSERTQEIGVRRSCGARQSDIRRQFMLEAGLLASAGALGGLFLGVLVVLLLTLAGWHTALSIAALTAALLVVVVTGLACGVYPAIRAARLEPAAALRAP